MFFLSAILLTVFWVAPTQAIASQKATMRKLHQYETAGPYVIGLQSQTGNQEDVQATIRQFIWAHLQRHRLARLLVTYYGKERDKSQTSYFIEPDLNSVWHVHVDIERTLSNLKRPHEKFHESVSYDSYVLQRIVPAANGLQEHPLTEMEASLSHHYQLRLIGKNGKVLTQI